MSNSNPRTDHLEKYTTDRPEACTAQINVRIPPSHKAKLKHIEGWQEGVRKYLEQIIEQQEKKSA